MEQFKNEVTLTPEEEKLYQEGGHSFRGLTREEFKKERDRALSVANAEKSQFVEFDGGIMKEKPDEDERKELSAERRN